jgi:2-polyprenyl-3-methyl-5-hydroxy-6-metoxy-1,4-benzoquinol methylase
MLFRKKRQEKEQITDQKDDSNHRDFSLNSGERQTGNTLDEIRFDHIARYKYAVDFLKNKYQREDEAFGLDAFCATGYGAYMITEALHCPVLGIDASWEAVSVGIKHYSNQNTFYVNKLFPFSLPIGTFDFITCIESLEHIEDQHAFVESLKASLKPGGYLFLSTPNEQLYSLRKNPNPFHFKHYSHEELVNFINNVGELRLIEWHGQDIYKMEEGKMCGTLEENEMGLKEKVQGQILFFIFQKL